RVESNPPDHAPSAGRKLSEERIAAQNDRRTRLRQTTRRLADGGSADQTRAEGTAEGSAQGQGHLPPRRRRASDQGCGANSGEADREDGGGPAAGGARDRGRRGSDPRHRRRQGAVQITAG